MELAVPLRETMTSELVVALINALSHADGVPPDDLDYSLHESIDTDAILALEAHPNTSWELSFDVPEHEVTVSGQGFITVDGVKFDTTTPFMR